MSQDLKKNDLNGLHSYKIISGKIRKFIKIEDSYQNLRISIASEAFINTRNVLLNRLLQYMTLSLWITENFIKTYQATGFR